ncbi:hypothetical protein EDC04DRAFT_2915362 [Pisolithus marmoratus]|nr:hypothetical protein EDC04DRAFT_2915362 [Pisolithus marmoratus]
MSSCNPRPCEPVETIGLTRSPHCIVSELTSPLGKLASGKAAEHELGDLNRKRGIFVTLRWKSKLARKDGQAVIRDDVLSLSSGELGAIPCHQISLATLKALQGANPLRRACDIGADQRAYPPDILDDSVNYPSNDSVVDCWLGGVEKRHQ